MWERVRQGALRMKLPNVVPGQSPVGGLGDKVERLPEADELLKTIPQ